MRKKTKTGPVWSVRVSPAREAPGHYFDGRRGTPIEGRVAVRITCNGEDRYTYATLKVSDPHFGDKVTTAKAEALERASDLQAVGAE